MRFSSFGNSSRSIARGTVSGIDTAVPKRGLSLRFLMNWCTADTWRMALRLAATLSRCFMYSSSDTGKDLNPRYFHITFKAKILLPGRARTTNFFDGMIATLEDDADRHDASKN